MPSGIRMRLVSFFYRASKMGTTTPSASSQRELKVDWIDVLQVICRPELGIRAQRSPALADAYQSLMAVVAEQPSVALARTLGQKSAQFLAALVSDVGEAPPATTDEALHLLERESKLGAEDARFLGDLLSMRFLSDHFGLDLAVLSASLPVPLQPIAEKWLLIYALWLCRLYVEAKYGSDFARTMMVRAIQKFEEAEELVPECSGGLAEGVYVGMRRLKMAATFFKDGKEGKLGDKVAHLLTETIPLELIAATAFLMHDPSSPYFGKEELPDSVDTELAVAFGHVRSKLQPWIDAKIAKLASGDELVREFRKKADQGDAEAQVALGRMYAAGQGVPQDDAEALKWFRKAADQGDATAQALLGAMYYKGYGVVVPQDYSEALKWSRTAADQGNAAAQTLLGFLYSNGYGVPQDYSEALKWSRMAADQGDADAQCHLGYLYGTGHGTPQDNTEALKWFRKAADQGDAQAETALGIMSAAGKVSQEYAETLKLHRKAEQGDRDAQGLLGFMYQNGKGVPQDYIEAVKWYRKAADQGDARAQITLGYLFLKGEVLPQDYDEAVKWYQKAADQGDAAAQISLGIMYRDGWGVSQDDVLAHMWLNLAANQNHTVEDRKEAAELRDNLLPLMTPAQIAEAQRLAREWKPK
jgi:uncharacterized protein